MSRVRQHLRAVRRRNPPIQFARVHTCAFVVKASTADAPDAFIVWQILGLDDRLAADELGDEARRVRESEENREGGVEVERREESLTVPKKSIGRIQNRRRHRETHREGPTIFGVRRTAELEAT